MHATKPRERQRLNPGINFYPVMACGLVISMIVPILLIFLGQKHFIKGLTFGAVK